MPRKAVDVWVAGAMLGRMKRPRRATVRLDPELHRALREEAARNDRSVSELVNTAVRRSLGDSPRSIRPLAPLPETSELLFESVLKRLKRRRKI